MNYISQSKCVKYSIVKIERKWRQIANFKYTKKHTEKLITSRKLHLNTYVFDHAKIYGRFFYDINICRHNSSKNIVISIHSFKLTRKKHIV